jgi:DNA-binding winged helix-turn-helix (wHTH) protein
MDIKWDERTLRDMLGKRMTLLSVDQTAPYRSLGELCEDEQNLSTLIDPEIASFAQGNPRAAIWLANRLIEQHCDSYPPPTRIAPHTWEKVKRAWRDQGESRILGTSMPSGFRVLSDRIYYQNKEIILPERSDRLLKALILAKEGFCSKRELREAGWIDDKNPEGISEKALSEAMRRMKGELKQELKDKSFRSFDCIKSVRSRGYRLLQPDAGQNLEEGLND